MRSRRCRFRGYVAARKAPTLKARPMRPISMQLLALAFLVACGPSAEEQARKAKQVGEALTKKVRAAEAAEKQRAQQATLTRLAKAQAAEEALERRASETAKQPPAPVNSAACPITAERMLERMRSCGLNMEGVSPPMLCAKFRQVQLNFLASRQCDEIGAMFSD